MGQSIEGPGAGSSASGSDAPRVELAPRPALPEWADRLAFWLDDAIRIPGTRIGFGLDAILGMLVPVVGDAVTAIGSAALLILAMRRRVPKIALLRMVMNIGIDALVGSVPVLGDLFDVAFRANRKNLELLKSYENEPTRPAAASDYVLVGLGIVLLVLAVVLPLLVLLLFAERVASVF